MPEKEEEYEEEYVFEFYEASEDSPLKSCVKFVEDLKKGHEKDDMPFIMGPDEKPFKITNERIFSLHECEDVRSIGFVDAGNAPLINSADFNISIHRVAGTIFRESQLRTPSRVPEVIEFFTATVLNPKEDNSLEFITKFFPREPEHQQFLPREDLVMNIRDEWVLRGKFLPKIERFGSIARRFVEWSYGKEFINQELAQGDIFVRDGSLQTGVPGEIKYAYQLYQNALLKKVYVTGLSKSCRLLTNRGDSLISVIDLLAKEKFPNQTWYYHPIYQITKADNQADLYFVKLHRHSYYPFRFDIYIEQSKDLDKDEREVIISNLASNSKDLSFPGYPYGLIKVDQLSRIAFQELDSQKIILLSEFDNENYKKFILPRLRSVDAHDILNKIRKN